MVALESTKLFGSLSAADTALLNSAARVRDYPDGEIIFKEGDAGDGMYVVRAGCVQISALVGQGDRKVLARLRPGDYFGEMAIIDNEPRSASAVTEGATSVYFLPRDLVLKLLERSPILAISLLREFSHRMRTFNKTYIDEVLQAERLTLVGRFARSIVHDFKNPLNIIGLAAEMAGMDGAAASLRASAVNRIHKQVDRLSNMISEMMEFTRGSQHSTVPASTSYAKVIEQVLEDLRPECGEKHVEIVCDRPPDIDLLVDPQRLTHVFFNLVHNAVDAMMPNGGKIFIRFQKFPYEIVTEIEDTGKGIDPEILPRLFEAFATYGKSNGTGLGLSICRKIVNDHKGHIEAHTYPGRGAVFSFGLPLPAA